MGEVKRIDDRSGADGRGESLTLADLGIDPKGAGYLRQRYPHVPREVMIDMCLRARALELDVLTGQLMPVKVSGKWTIQTSIEGLRAMADRTGCYAPAERSVEYERYPDTGELILARVWVRKHAQGEWHDYFGEAHYEEYVGRKRDGEPNFMWGSKPHVMLAKCAEAQALRRGWPHLGRIYISEEMGQDGEGVEP